MTPACTAAQRRRPLLLHSRLPHEPEATQRAAAPAIWGPACDPSPCSAAQHVCRIVKLVRALRKGWIKREAAPEKPDTYLIWEDDGGRGRG